MDDEIKQLLDTTLLPKARQLKAQSALLSRTAAEAETVADRIFDYVSRCKAPKADADALLNEAQELIGEFRACSAKWEQFIKDFNHLC